MKKLKKKLEEAIDPKVFAFKDIRYKDLLKAVMPLLREVEKEYHKRENAGFLSIIEELLK